MITAVRVLLISLLLACQIVEVSSFSNNIPRKRCSCQVRISIECMNAPILSPCSTSIQRRLGTRPTFYRSQSYAHNSSAAFSNDYRSNGSNSTPRETVRQELLKLLSSTPRNAPTSRLLTLQILSKVSELENHCPTRDDEVLKKLGGNWELLWTAQDGQNLKVLSSQNPFLFAWINPLENQSYSNNPDKSADKTILTDRANPSLARGIQDIFSDAKTKSYDSTFPIARSSQFVDLTKSCVRNTVTFNTNNQLAFLSPTETMVTITVDISFRPNSTDSRRIDVKFDSCRAKLPLLDFTIPLGLIGPSGWLRTGYIDHEIRVTRGHKGSVFILSKL